MSVKAKKRKPRKNRQDFDLYRFDFSGYYKYSTIL